MGKHRHTRVAHRLSGIEVLERRAYMAAISFAAKKSYAGGTATQGIVVGDFNADGKQDVVFSDYTGGKLGVLFGDGKGALGSRAVYSAGANISGATAGDLNGDGKLDLVATGDDLAVLINKGDGTFKAAVHLVAGDTPQNSTLVDVNNDGKLDLVAANVLGTFASVFLGKGDGTFQAQRKPTLAGQSDIVFGDVNGDGKLDLVASLFGDVNTSAGHGAAVLRGNGDGTFQAAVTYTVNGHPSAVRLADLDRDGDLDIVTANGGLANLGGADNFSVLKNNGNGTFASAVNVASAASTNSLQIADFNGDGNLDVATVTSPADGTHALFVHPGKGDGTFLTPIQFAVDAGGSGVGTADFNGDGLLDVVNTNTGTGTINLLLNTTAFASVDNGVLNITGTTLSDSIGVTLKSHKLNVRVNGNSLLFATSGITRMNILGGDGQDRIDFSATSMDTAVSAGSGDDSVVAGAGDDSILGGSGKDTLKGGDGDDRLSGAAGNDRIYGEAGNDRLYGAEGGDTVDGGGGTDRLYGEAGNDRLLGGSSNDRIYGGAGNDTLVGGRGVDLLDGGADSDTDESPESSDVLVSVEA